MSRASREKLAQEAADASQSGIIPIFGLIVLVVIVAALVRLIL